MKDTDKTYIAGLIGGAGAIGFLVSSIYLVKCVADIIRLHRDKEIEEEEAETEE